MGCEGCSTSNGVPKGCKSNGHCKSGGCNMLNTFDWLADMPIAFGSETNQYYEISFQNGSRKDFYKNERNVPVITGDLVVVETAMGHDIGRITLSGELVKLQMKKKKVKERSAEIRNIIRIPEQPDLQTWDEAKALEKDTMVRARAIARSMKLEMKIGHVEYQADKKKTTFYYTAEDRIDFRELIKVYAKEFKVKIEMRQIGARQEAGKIGGIGTCGRELCCSTWLTDFKSVSTNAARYQNLSINLSKLSGQCGRLKCCLNYELDTYMEALEEFPKKAEKLETVSGTATLQKTDILQRLMWYTYVDSPNFYPLTVDKVKEILEMNKADKKAQPLGELAIKDVDEEAEEEASAYEDTVGHITLTALEKTGKKKKKKKNKNRQGQGGQQTAGGGEQRQAQPGQQQRQQGQGQQNRQQRPGQQNRPQGQGQQNKPQGQGPRPQQPGGGDNPNQQKQGGNNRNRNRNRNRNNRGGGGGNNGGGQTPPAAPQNP